MLILFIYVKTSSSFTNITFFSLPSGTNIAAALHQICDAQRKPLRFPEKQCGVYLIDPDGQDLAYDRTDGAKATT